MKVLFLKLLYFFLFSIIIFQFISQFQFSHFDYDEGYNLLVSLNLHQNFQYATFDALFDPYITTGPTVLIPTAFLITDMSPVLPRLIIILYSLIFIFVVAKTFLVTHIQRVIFLITINLIPLFYFFGTHVLGEIPGFSLFLISLVFIFKKNYRMSGIFFILSYLTKAIYLLGIFSIIYVFLYSYLKDRNIKRILINVKSFLIGAFAILAIWHFYILISVQLDLSRYVDIVIKTYQVGHVKSAPLLNLFYPRTEMIGYVFGGNGLILVSSVIILTILMLIKTYRKYYQMNSIVIFFIVYVIYLLFFAHTNWYRHLFPGILALTIIFPLIIVTSINESSKKYRFIFLTSSILLIVNIIFSFVYPLSDRTYTRKLIEQNLVFEYQGITPLTKNDPILDSQYKTASYIRTNIEKNKHISGIDWWNAPEIAYLTKNKIERNPFSHNISYLISHYYGEKLAPKKNSIIINFPHANEIYYSEHYKIFKIK